MMCSGDVDPNVPVGDQLVLSQVSLTFVDFMFDFLKIQYFDFR